MTSDESIYDTVVDLLVYTLKYQTYLADQDSSVATTLFRQSSTAAPYSDGPSGFEALLAQQDMTEIEQVRGPTVKQTVRQISNVFDELEACFQGAPVSAEQRSAIAARLAETAISLIGSLIREAPERYRDFLLTDT